MSFIAVDLGASGSRYCSESGQVSVLPNNMVMLDAGETSNINPDASDIESCLEVKVTKQSGPACEHFPANVLIGIMAERHGDTNVRPLSITSKPKQAINYISAIISCAVARMKYNVDEAFDLYLAVPPLQMEEAMEKFGGQLPGTYVVSFPKYMGGTEVKLTVNDVITIEEESFMAITSFFFNMNGTVRESAKDLMSKTVLSLDIGASTTDIAIVKNGRYLDKSGQTYQYGGNIARSALVDAIRAKYTIELPVEDAEKVMAEGRLQLGNTYVDVSKEVSIAKTALAKQLANCMTDYFGKRQMPPTSIHVIVVSGGGSMQSQYVNSDGEVVKTSEPMSYFVTEEYKKWSQYTDVVAYGDEARFANIKGLFIKAKMAMLKKSQVQTQAIASQAQAVNTQPTVTPQVVQPVVQPAVQPTVNTTVETPQVTPEVQPAPQVNI